MHLKYASVYPMLEFMRVYKVAYVRNIISFLLSWKTKRHSHKVIKFVYLLLAKVAAT